MMNTSSAIAFWLACLQIGYSVMCKDSSMPICLRTRQDSVVTYPYAEEILFSVQFRKLIEKDSIRFSDATILVEINNQ